MSTDSHGRGSAELPEVGLITIWYDAGEQLERFLTDLRAVRYPRLTPVFVVHRQTESEVRRLRNAEPRPVVLETGANLGSAAGWNTGIRLLLQRGTAYIGLWNVDVRFDSECLTRLVDVMEADPAIGASQPLLLYSDADTTVEMFGGSVCFTDGDVRHDYVGVTAIGRLPSVRDAHYLDGGTMLMRASVLRQVGGFDERLFMYHEDADLSIRIRQAGYRTVAVREARAWHYHRQLNGVMPRPHAAFYQSRNRFYFARKYGGRSAWLRLLARTCIRLPRTSAFYLRRRQGHVAWAHIAGTLYGMIGLMGKRGWVD